MKLYLFYIAGDYDDLEDSGNHTGSDEGAGVGDLLYRPLILSKDDGSGEGDDICSLEEGAVGFGYGWGAAGGSGRSSPYPRPRRCIKR